MAVAVTSQPVSRRNGTSNGRKATVAEMMPVGQVGEVLRAPKTAQIIAAYLRRRIV
jgi:hypothetical protein